MARDKDVFERVGPEIKRRLGLAELARFQFLVGYDGEDYFIRLQGPETHGMDYQDGEKTKDILGLGQTMHEAVMNACSKYLHARALGTLFVRDVRPPLQCFQH